MLLAASQAFSKNIGLLVTFVGIGLIVNVILVYVAVQVRGERRQNTSSACASPERAASGLRRREPLGSWPARPRPRPSYTM